MADSDTSVAVLSNPPPINCSTVTTLSRYETQQLQAIRDWQASAPGWGTRLLARPGSKVASVVKTLVPEDALRAALDGVNQMAEKLAAERSLLRRAGVGTLDELRNGTLEQCDRLMRGEQRRAMAMAGAGGAAFGVAGAAGMAVDVPTLIGLALRTIHRVGLCYGENLRGTGSRRLAIGIFALASANSVDEKQTAIGALQRFEAGSLDTAAWRDGVERAAEREFAKEAAVFSLRNLAARLGINLGQRKALGMIPLLGAVVGGSVNAWYLYDIGQVSRYVFQERWLSARYELAELQRLLAPDDGHPLPPPASS